MKYQQSEANSIENNDLYLILTKDGYFRSFDKNKKIEKWKLFIGDNFIPKNNNSHKLSHDIFIFSINDKFYILKNNEFISFEEFVKEVNDNSKVANDYSLKAKIEYSFYLIDLKGGNIIEKNNNQYSGKNINNDEILLKKIDYILTNKENGNLINIEYSVLSIEEKNSMNEFSKENNFGIVHDLSNYFNINKIIFIYLYEFKSKIISFIYDNIIFDKIFNNKINIESLVAKNNIENKKEIENLIDSKDTGNRIKMFLKSPKEMRKISVNQKGQSQCGPTAVINILSSLDFSPLPTPRNLLKFFPPRLRNYKTRSLSKYLYSRAVAGTIHEEIIDTVEKISNNEIIGKFFIIKEYENKDKFSEWIKECFKNKLALVFTENLFIKGYDSWHHQMAYGIKNDKIYLTNSMSKIPVSQMISFITAGQWMIIPKKHVIDRNINEEDIKELKTEKWSRFKVLERAINLKSFNEYRFFGHSCFDGLTIPYGGIGGVSAFCKKDNYEGMKFLEKYTTNEEDIYLPFYEKKVKANRLDI